MPPSLQAGPLLRRIQGGPGCASTGKGSTGLNCPQAPPPATEFRWFWPDRDTGLHQPGFRCPGLITWTAVRAPHCSPSSSRMPWPPAQPPLAQPPCWTEPGQPCPAGSPQTRMKATLFTLPPQLSASSAPLSAQTPHSVTHPHNRPLASVSWGLQIGCFPPVTSCPAATRQNPTFPSMAHVSPPLGSLPRVPGNSQSCPGLIPTDPGPTVGTGLALLSLGERGELSGTPVVGHKPSVALRAMGNPIQAP